MTSAILWQVFAYRGSMIFPEIVRIFDRWCVSFCSSKFQAINNATYLDHVSNTHLRCLPYLWNIRIRMYTPSGFHFSLYYLYTSPSKGNSPCHSHSKESPSIPGKCLVRLLAMYGRIWSLTCCGRKCCYPHNRDHRSWTVWKHWN